MKKIPRKLLIVAFLALAGTLTLWWPRQHEQNPWQPLPKRGEVRLYAVTYGNKHEIEYGSPPFPQRFADAIKTFSWRPLLYHGGRTGGSYGGRPSMVVWLLERGRNDGRILDLSDCVLELPDGQTLRGTQSGGGSTGGGLSHAKAYFEQVPYRARTLRFVTKIDGRRFEFETLNPAWRANLPSWTAAPLPQTRENGDVGLTLHTLRLKLHEGMTTDWEASPEWAVTARGEKADAWFEIRTKYEDAGGNVSSSRALLSEPVWKVRATVVPNSLYPFPDAEVRWLGTLQPEQPAAQTTTIFPLGAATRGLELVGVFGPGQYDLKAGVVVKTAPPMKTERNEITNLDFATGTLHVRLERPALLVGGSTDAGLVIRDEQGRAVKLREQWGVGGAVELMIYDLPDHPVRVGLADRAPLEFEFFVRPPVIPAAPSAPVRP